MIKFDRLTPPSEGELIRYENGKLVVPNFPIIPQIEGDGIGTDISPVVRMVVGAALHTCYHNDRKIIWFPVHAGDAAREIYGDGISDEELMKDPDRARDVYLPEDTLKAIKHYKVAIKGPLTTPIGTGFKSLNVGLRQALELYTCIRPVYWLCGAPAPVRHPQDVNIVIFRENIEDVYSGLEWPAGSTENLKLRKFLEEDMGIKTLKPNPLGLGIKPMSEFGSKRLVRKALRWAIKNKLPSVTLMHKGNIMKYTEGAFMRWGYEVAKEDKFKDKVVTAKEVAEKYNGKIPEGKVLMKDVLADAIFQQVLLRPREYSVIATLNLNGDYISDALAAQVGGLGTAPGSNFSDEIAIFEATHGTAPKYKGLDKVNPGSLLLSAVMMLQHLGWNQPADLIREAISKTVQERIVTYDFAREMREEGIPDEDIIEVKCSDFGKQVVKNVLLLYMGEKTLDCVPIYQ